MPKKKAATTSGPGKAAIKAAKKAKAAAKSENKEVKKLKPQSKGKGKSKVEEEDDQDLEAILNRFRIEYEAAHAVQEETLSGPPERRANATFIPCPSPGANHLWLIGGELFSDDGKAHFYNDVFHQNILAGYSPDKNEWRKFTSPNCPGPRSAHAVCGSPSGGGKLFLFGGEFSSLYQNSFHHYRDFWVFDIATKAWDRIETRGTRPIARSGHRMVIWKHFVVLFGGFVDPGVRTNYLQDLWLFDTQEYKWIQVEFRENERRPSPRSGFSFLPIPEGAIVHGGYCKEYTKGKRPRGVILEDTWLLKMDIDHKQIKWEKRKKIGYAPSPRSGCTMAYWPNKSMGVMFGGVWDDDRDEETLESVFYQDMFGYQTAGNGRWISLALKKHKKKLAPGSHRKDKKPITSPIDDENEDQDSERSDEDKEDFVPPTPTTLEDDAFDPTDPIHTIPLVRYNAMMAVLRNTLYIYGGIYERGAREYTLDDFHSLQLDKLDRFVCLKESVVVPAADANDESEDDEDDDEDDDTADEDDELSEDEDIGIEDDELNAEVPFDIRAKAQAILKAPRPQALSISSPTEPISAMAGDDANSTPLPGETLATFYARTREHWTQKARMEGGSENRGKMLRRDGFGLAEERWEEYKPVLEEVERILKEADAENVIQKDKGPAGTGQDSRNRR